MRKKIQQIKEEFLSKGGKIPICISNGCENNVIVRDWKYFSFKEFCSDCHTRRRKEMPPRKGVTFPPEDYIQKIRRDIDTGEIKDISDLDRKINLVPLTERIKFLVASKDESEILEYKEIISESLDDNLKKNKINYKVIKTIAAFLNSRGGELLVGVSECNKTHDHNIEGIDREIKRFYKNTDKFLLSFKDVLAQRIGNKFSPYINQHLIKVDDKYVFYIKCDPSQQPVFVDGKDFFIRTKAATDKIEGQEVQDYIKLHLEQ